MNSGLWVPPLGDPVLDRTRGDRAIRSLVSVVLSEGPITRASPRPIPAPPKCHPRFPPVSWYRCSQPASLSPSVRIQSHGEGGPEKDLVVCVGVGRCGDAYFTYNSGQ
jgi:hypothetical protein